MGAEPPCYNCCSFVGTQPPQIFASILFSKAHWPCFQCFLWYCYDEFPPYYMAIEVIVDVGYIISQLD